MSLVDETNREIPLSLEGGVTLSVDADHESTRKPAEIVWIIVDDDHHEPIYRLTYDEARKLHDRLGLILGRPVPSPDVRRNGEAVTVEFSDAKLTVLGEVASWESLL